MTNVHSGDFSHLADTFSSVSLSPSSSQSSSKSRILIVGAGLSGLALAVGLRKFSDDVEVQLIERDASLQTRNQGFNLTLKNIEYVWARCGLLQAIRDYNCTTRSYFTYKDDGSILQQFALDSIMCCPRELLRDTMLQQLDTNKQIRTNTTLRDVNELADGRVSVTLNDGTSSTYDLVVGADGLRSTLTPRVAPSSTLNYLGVVLILGTATTSHPRARNRFQMMDGTHRLFCKPWSETKAFWQVTFRATLEESVAMSKLTGKQIMALVKEKIGEWASPVPEFLATTDEDHVYAGPLYDREPTLLADTETNSNKNHLHNVALIGDAAHSMSPFRGEGANNAMEDGILLADMIGEAIAAAAATAESETDNKDSSDESTTSSSSSSSSDEKEKESKKLHVAWSSLVRSFHERMMNRVVDYVMQSRVAVDITHDPRCTDKEFMDANWDYKYKLAKII